VSAPQSRDDEAARRFADQFGNILADSGWPRMSARVFAAILASKDGRMTAAELSDQLQASPAAISGAVRYLLQLHLAVRERDPGSRRDVYSVQDDAWLESILQQDKALVRWQDSLRQGVAAAGKGTPASHRIATTLAFTEFLQGEVADLIERWRKHKAELDL